MRTTSSLVRVAGMVFQATVFAAVCAAPALVPAIARAQVTVTVSPLAKSVAVDEVFGVEIRLDAAGNAVAAGAVFLAFDPERLEFVAGAVDRDVWNLGFLTTEPREAQGAVVSFSVGTMVPVDAADVPVATLSFRALAAGRAELALLFDPGAENTVFTAADLFTEYPTTGVDGAVEIIGPTPSPTPAVPSCGGDCSGDGSVTVDEILQMVGVALGSSAVTACPRGDGNDDGEITVDEILAAVQHALAGCPAEPAARSN